MFRYVRSIRYSLLTQSLLALLFVVVCVVMIGISVTLVHKRARHEADVILNEEMPMITNGLRMIDELNAIYLDLYAYVNFERGARQQFYDNVFIFNKLKENLKQVMPHHQGHEGHMHDLASALNGIEQSLELFLEDAEKNIFGAFDPELERLKQQQADRLYREIDNYIVRPLQENNLELSESTQFVELINLAFDLRESMERNYVQGDVAQEQYFRSLQKLQASSAQICVKILLLECGHFTRKLNELEELGAIYFQGNLNISHDFALERIERYEESYLQSMKENIKTIIVISSEAVDIDIVNFDDTLKHLQNAIAVATILVILVIASLFWLIWQKILSPLYEFSKILREFSDKNYDIPIKAPKGRSEVVRIYHDLAELKSTLIELDRLRDDEIKSVEKKSLLELQKTNRKLRRSEESLLRQKSWLESANADMEQFVHIASHDFKEPLKNIVGIAQMILAGAKMPDFPVEKRVEQIRSNVERVNVLIDDLKVLSRIQKVDEPSAPCSLNVVLSEAIANNQEAIDGRHASIKIGDLPDVLGYERYLRIVFDQLISNALHYGAEKLSISVSAVDTSNKEYLTIEVTNNLDHAIEKSDALFLPFKRGQNADRSSSGVGLSVCRKIIEDMHNGKIRLKETDSKTFSVQFLLPIFEL